MSKDIILFLRNALIVSFFIFSSSSIFSQEKKNLEKISLLLKWHHQFQFAGYYVAKYKGYYEEANLDVDIIEGGPNISYEKVLSGEMNFGVADSRILLAKMNKKPIVALAAIFQHTPDAIVTRKDKKIRIPSQFIGKKIMLAESSIPPSIQAIFIMESISLSSLTTLPNSNGIETLTNGEIDALIGYASNEPYKLKTNGVDTYIFYPHDYGIDFYGDMLYTSETEIENKKERAKEFLNASLHGWQYAMDNIEETTDLILNTPELNKNKEITKEYLLYEAKTLESIIIPKVIRVGHINPNRIEKTAQIFKEIGLFTGEYSLDGFIFDANPKVDIKWKSYLYLAASIFIALSIIFTLSIIILRKLVKIRTSELLESKKRLEKVNNNLEKSESKYKNFIENSQDIIFSLNGDGNILTINKAVHKILRYNVNELIGKNFAELLYNTETTSHLELFIEIFKYTIQEIIQTKKPISFNSELTNKVGEPKEISVSLQYVQMDSDFVLLGTASLVKEDELLKFCEEQKQIFNINNFITHVDAICYRLPNAALKYSDQETVFNIRTCLREMLINAVEHGNLDIDFNEKTVQQANGDYLHFLIERQKEAKYTNRLVRIEFLINSELISFRITDEGNGFDHKELLNRASDAKEIQYLGHGRGLIIARDFFDRIEYNEKGNSVYIVKYFSKNSRSS